MLQNNLTDTKIDELSALIDHQLRELSTAPPVAFRGVYIDDKRLTLPVKQLRAIEEATGEAAESFWTRFKRAAWRDLCQEDGLLYQQWQKWRDLNNKDLIKILYGVLAGMGIHGNILYVLVVATAVIIIHLGITAICEEGGDK